jgi:hypothetical protein
MDAAASGAIMAQTNEAAADGEIVWSWRPDAGAKFVDTNHGRRWQQSPVTGEITYKP